MENLDLRATEEIKVFTDGSFMKTKMGELCGYGINFPNKEYPNVGRPFKHMPMTNQRAELYAIYKAIKTIIESGSKSKIMIYTDSEYSIKSLTEWAPNWEKNNWKNSQKKDVMNQDIIKPIYNYLKKRPGRINFKHVRSHTGKLDWESINNESADQLATNGAKKLLNK